MPKVPVSPGRAVQVQPLENRPLRYTPARNLVGEQVERLGERMSGLADGLHDLALRKSEYDAKEGALALGDVIDQHVNNPETGLFRLQGKAAVDAYEGTLKELDTAAEKLSADRKSPLAKRMFDDNASARLEAIRKQVGAFVVRERQVYEDATDRAMFSTELRDAARSWNDDEQVEVGLATAASVIAKMANRGRSLEWAQDQMEVAESGVRRDVAEARIANLGPDAGEAYFKKHEAAFSPDDARAVQSSIRIRREAIAADGRRVAAEQRAAQAAARAERREQLATLRSELDTGAGSSADWVALAEGYTAIGDTSNAATARAKAGETRAVETYRGAPLPTLDSEIATLEAKKGSLSPDMASKLNGLRTLRDQTAARLNQPGGALRQEQYATGRVVAPLDASNPDSFRARATSAVAAAQRHGGRIEPLFDDDVRRLQGDMQGEAAQRLKVLRTITLFRDPRAIEGAARQLTGEGDGDFRIAATLIATPGGEQLATEVLRGRDALAVTDKAFNQGIAQNDFAQNAAPALAGMPPDYARDVFDAAKAVYAERARQQGVTTWSGELWRGAVNAALGGEPKSGRQYGGLAKFGDKWVSIPPGWTGDGVFKRIATMDGDDLGRARVSDPGMWPDGSKVYTGQLREMTPVRLGGTRYGFLTRAGRLLGTRSGRPYAIDVAKLPWKQ